MDGEEKGEVEREAEEKEGETQKAVTVWCWDFLLLPLSSLPLVPRFLLFFTLSSISKAMYINGIPDMLL